MALNVLMIGIGGEVLDHRMGDARARHIEYARRIGRLHMVVWTRASDSLEAAELGEGLSAHPTSSPTRLHFLRDAYRLGAFLIRAEPVDLIVTQDPFATGLVGAWLKRAFGIPLLVGNHSRFLDNPHWIQERPIRNRAFNMLGSRVIERADALRVVNTVEREIYVAKGIPRERIHLLPTPIDLARFTASPDDAAVDEVRKRWGVEGKSTALWVGDPSQVVKDIGTLLRCAAMIAQERPDFVLLLVGDFSRRPEWVERVRTLGLEERVRFAGRVPHEAIQHFYHAAQIYLHTSLYEGFPKAHQEAAAAGLPVVTTRVDGIEEVVIEGQTGLLRPRRDADGLAEAALSLLENPNLRYQMGKAGREHALARYDRSARIDAIVRAWEDTARGGKNAEGSLGRIGRVA